ncbi:MAG: YtxH domain-containing protein [Acidimicrobiales bacterium]
MRFRLGLAIGLAVGYYYGAKAGRERYHQIEDVLDRVRDSSLYRDVRDRVDRTLPQSLERARVLLDDRTAVTTTRFGDPTFN